MHNVKINNAIQTNGIVIDKKWARFFADNNFLVGISLDGIKKTHNAYRVEEHGNGTFEKVMQTVELLKSYNVEYNILTVVNKNTAENIARIYSFYKKCGFSFLQFIACLDPIGENLCKQDYSLTPQLYGKFLCDLFDLWFEDLKIGTQPYIRSFENYVAIMCGQPPESCDMRGTCGMQYVIEADGSVYPCDFYVLDEYRLGNMVTDSVECIDEERKKTEFIEKSFNLPLQCSKCTYFKLCRGGCGRNRLYLDIEKTENYFCESNKVFFNRRLKVYSK